MSAKGQVAYVGVAHAGMTRVGIEFSGRRRNSGRCTIPPRIGINANR